MYKISVLRLVQKPIVMLGPTVCGITVNSKFLRLGVNPSLYYYIIL